MYNEKNKENEALLIDLKNQFSEIDRKIKQLEERYIMKEIDRDLFSRFKSHFLEERSFLTEQAAKSQKESSNLESCLKPALRHWRKLATTWAFGDFEEKQARQESCSRGEFLTIAIRTKLEPQKQIQYFF